MQRNLHILTQYVHTEAPQGLDACTHTVKIKGLALQSAISSTLDVLRGTRIIKKMSADKAQVNTA